MEKPTNCPNCNAEIKSAIFGSNDLMPNDKSLTIRTFTTNKSASHCEKCGPTLYAEAKTNRKTQVPELENEVRKSLPYLPILTLQNPNGWEYKVIKIVTAQTATGEGAIAEMSASFSELFGTQNNRLSNKFKTGESSCMDKLRLEAAYIGANAVLATDIDFSEVGPDNGMLMVCMAGTAVKVSNMSVFEDRAAAELQKLSINGPRLVYLKKFDAVF